MWRFIVGLLATVGTLTLLGIGGCAAFLVSGSFSTKTLPQNIVLSVDLRDVPSETGSSGLLRDGLFGGSRDIVETVQQSRAAGSATSPRRSGTASHRA